MKKLTVSDIRSIKIGTSVTFHLDSSTALYSAAALVSDTKGRYMSQDRKNYSCVKDKVASKITIEAKSID